MACELMDWMDTMDVMDDMDWEACGTRVRRVREMARSWGGRS
jgi:hypothetical protein